MFSVWGSSDRFVLAIIQQKIMKHAWRGHDFVDNFITELGNVLKCYSTIPSIDTDIFPP